MKIVELQAFQFPVAFLQLAITFRLASIGSSDFLDTFPLRREVFP
jgi:hypothetical protein